jgi:DNA modification methylase
LNTNSVFVKKKTTNKINIENMKMTKLMKGDNIESLKKLPDNSVDSVVTDPPYGLKFMGKKWDHDVPSVNFWKEVYRVLKPGGHVLSFGGTRTYHRMVVNIEDAGFEIRDQIMWLYGSGFPKSHNIGKAIDATIKTGKSNPKSINKSEMSKEDGEVLDVIQPNNGILGDKKLVTKNVGASLETEEAQEWQGWGTALKPANEPICLARKPLSEKTIAKNVLKWGTGGINIDGCRVGSETINTIHNPKITGKMGQSHGEQTGYIDGENSIHEGRFPANIILECLCDDVIKGEKGEVIEHNGTGGIWNEGTKEPVGRTYNDKGDIHTNPMCPCYMLDEQSGVLKSGEVKPHHKKNKTANGYQGSCYGKFKNEDTSLSGYGDKGGASRYFKQIKGGGTEDFFIYKENNIILWNIKSLDTQEYNAGEYGEALDALKQARESICQKPELYGNNIMVKYLMSTIYITKMKTHSIMNLTILNAYTKTTIGNFTLMIDEKQSHLLTEESILNVQIVSNQNALVSSIKTNQEVLVPIVSYVLEENLVSGETIIENTITNTTENIESDRFFYQAKVSKKERNMGLDGFEDKLQAGAEFRPNHMEKALNGEDGNPYGRYTPTKNVHPTVKPVNLMAYLCRLVTPPNGIVLDPYMGSGSTGIAAQLEGFRFVGMELDEDYFKIAEARINDFESYRKFIKK